MIKILKKILEKYSIFISLIFCYYMWNQCNSVYIPVFDIELSWITLAKMSYLLTLTWFLSPVGKFCKHGGLCEIIYNIMPVLLMGSFVFMQYHPYIGIVVFSISLILVVICYLDISCVQEDERLSLKRKKRILRREINKTLILSGMLFLVPSIYTFANGIKAPVYVGQTMLEYDKISNEHIYLEELLEENKQVLKGMKQEKWSKLSESSKVDYLKTIADIEATYLQVKKPTVMVDVLEPLTRAQYSDEENTIKINRNVILDNSVEELIETVLHEMYHSYQHHMVESIDIVNNEGKSAYYGDIRNWKEDFQNYTTSFGDGYYIQSIEVSARFFAEQQTEVYMQYIEGVE